jgi:hypothetical protein
VEHLLYAKRVTPSCEQFKQIKELIEEHEAVRKAVGVSGEQPQKEYTDQDLDEFAERLNLSSRAEVRRIIAQGGLEHELAKHPQPSPEPASGQELSKEVFPLPGDKNLYCFRIKQGNITKRTSGAYGSEEAAESSAESALRELMGKQEQSPLFPAC